MNLFAGVSARNEMKRAKAVAKADVAQAEADAESIADNTLRTVGKLQTSFLQSGIVLESAGVREVLSQAFQSGRTAVSDTVRNANTKARNTVTAARSKALDTIAAGVMKSGVTDAAGGLLDSAWQGSWAQDSWNSFGQTIGGALDPSPVGPYQHFGF